MWYYKARIYNPALGRFMQTDPIGYGDGMNWMNYVGGDPVNFSDPSGLDGVAGPDTWSCNKEDGCIVVTGPGLGFTVPEVTRIPLSWQTNGEIVVTARGRSTGGRNNGTNSISLLSALFDGPTFCSGAKFGPKNKWNPDGRVNTGKIGGLNAAFIDLDILAAANGLIPAATVIVDRDKFLIQARSPIPLHAGNGWWIHTNAQTGYIVLSNRGLALRLNRFSRDIRIDIPAASALPSGAISKYNETCHYGW